MIVMLVGPTCGGKSTLEAALQARGFGRAVSHTTREARAGEVCGDHYHFVNDCTFDALSARGDFIETNDLGTRRYAMSKQALHHAAQQGHVVMVIEPNGAANVSAYCKAEGLAHTRVWIDCDAKLRARRWMERVVADLAMPPSFSAAKLDAASERLGLMLDTERAWDTEAHMVASMYEYFIDSTSTSAQELARQIEEVIRKR